MFDDIQDLYAVIHSVVVAVDVEISLLVIALVVIYCIVGILSIKAKGSRESSQSDLSALKADVEKLTQEVNELRDQVRGRAMMEAPPSPQREASPKEAARVEAVSEAPQVQEVRAETAPVTETVTAPKVEASTIANGMAKSRTSLLGKIKGLFSSRKTVDLAGLDDLEEMLITSDVGARVSDSLVNTVRERASQNQEVNEAALRDLLKEGIRRELIPVAMEHRMYHPVGNPLVMLVVGVNGVGKTTTVAKLATRYQQQGKKVVAIAADTFRAAAVQQLKEWGNRSGFSVYSGAENAKPAAVVFDGMVAAKEQGADVVLIDTAGRLHTKSNLMQELEGVRNSIRRHVPDAPHETILVVDGVSGQNALSQAREFNSSTPLTGLVVTKLDGTPKGGIIVAISQELKIPVFYVGVGEKAHDLLPFLVEEFVEGLLSDEGDGVSAGSPRVPPRGSVEAVTVL
jgi:fused signal recognition particle receptor